MLPCAGPFANQRIRAGRRRSHSAWDHCTEAHWDTTKRGHDDTLGTLKGARIASASSAIGSDARAEAFIDFRDSHAVPGVSVISMSLCSQQLSSISFVHPTRSCMHVFPPRLRQRSVAEKGALRALSALAVLLLRPCALLLCAALVALVSLFRLRT